MLVVSDGFPFGLSLAWHIRFAARLGQSRMVVIVRCISMFRISGNIQALL